ncbi:uncharacterized protein B0P05DRAFT_472190 [Gilbertella persicaria]|uniref:uncharacterized protein n=1 Tax=Gilbertella persicaria TaxID=101096 RepID=UPI0022204E9A|nr:uncharacterized protein B0P05DRAFT_472190 [Gilbertella persicaria]KAI8076421.1 hypothetical protein B0P05DRAFT_472190 [Gilbertella persicaria]
MNKIDLNAYTIPLLHAAKYPSSDVCGVLLGKNEKELMVKTAVPFFHHWTTVTPMLEVALRQTEIYAKENDLVIVGWYHGNARLEDTSLPERAVKVAETIKKNSASNKAVLFMAKNQWKKQKDPFTASDNDFSLTDKETYTKVRGLFSASAYHRIHDFDEHVEDVSIEWLETSKLFI